MTAPEPTPTAEHIDAVARHLPYLVPWERLTEGSRNDYRRKARRIMDDPAVHEALAANLPADVMLAALVRAGVLAEETRAGLLVLGKIRNYGTEQWADVVIAEERARPDGVGVEKVIERRHATPWQVAP